MRRASLAITAALLLSLATAAPAGAATVEVQARDYAFEPTTVRLAAPGDAARWRNTGAAPHTSTGNAPLAYWSSPTIAPGGTYRRVFVAAGSYGYTCQFHSGMVGTVKVPVRAAPTAGTTATTFTITWASVSGASGVRRYQVQRKAPGATTWSLWRSTTAASGTFKTSLTGSWYFRARLQRWDGDSWVSSGWSAARRVSVSAA
jgi:plastocyanin